MDSGTVQQEKIMVGRSCEISFTTRMPRDWQTLIGHHLQSSTRPLVVIVGPTASGKTALSLDVALFVEIHRQNKFLDIFPVNRRFKPPATDMPPYRNLFRAEIVNADSRQLYKHLDIGTAKIRPEEMRGIPHHLLSILDPKEKVTAGWYKGEATTIIDEILARSSVPILVGGSMLYISAIIDGLVFAGRGAKEKIPVPYDLLIFGIDAPRPVLQQRISTRLEKLLNEGWIDEVQQLQKKGYTEKDPGLESLGYREIIAFLNGTLSREKLLDEILRKTMQYVKRQRTWWREDQRIHWIKL